MKTIVAGLVILASIIPYSATACTLYPIFFNALNEMNVEKILNYVGTVEKADFSKINTTKAVSEAVKNNQLLRRHLDNMKKVIAGANLESKCTSKQIDTIVAMSFSRYEKLKVLKGNENELSMSDVNSFYNPQPVTESPYYKISSWSDYIERIENAIAIVDKSIPLMEKAIQENQKAREEESVRRRVESEQLAAEIAKEKALLEKEKQELAELEAKKRELLRIQEARDQLSTRSQSGSPAGVTSGTGTTGDTTIKKGAILCISEAAFDRQMDALGDGDMRIFGGCKQISSTTRGWFQDISMLSGTCTVLDINRNTKFWLVCEDMAKD